MYLTILDYTGGTTEIVSDPARGDEDFDYNEWIIETFGKIDYHYIVGASINLNI